jgi:hypothetical protein
MENLELIFPYTATWLTDQIDVVPNLFGMINDLNLFPRQAVTSRIVELRYENHILRVLPAKERGAPATPAQARTGQTIFVEIPHFPEVDLITPQDVQDILIQVANTKRPTTVEEEVTKRLLDIKRTHDITLEWLRSGALQGIIQDGNSQTIYNLYQVFGINGGSPIQIDFALGTTTGGAYGTGTDMIAKCQALYQAIATNLQGETMTGIEVICDPTFFNRFVEHPAVEKFYVNNMAAMEIARMMRQVQQQATGSPTPMYGREFPFQNIRFREYFGTAPVKSSPTAAIAATPFYAANTGTAYPVGTLNMFKTYDAPANDLRFVNSPGLPVYVSPEFLKHGKGLELQSESNPLPICRRPAAVVQLISSN